jgi:glycosyltransferase involved in cell wall biosynthesis
MTQENKDFFYYHRQYFGGTESMARYFHKNIAQYVPNLKKYLCLILPGEINGSYSNLILQEKQIILWLHNLVDQFGDGMYVLFTDKRFLDKIKYIITVSEYHKQDVIKKTGIDPDKVIVIYNAIDFVENDLSKFNNAKIPELVYTSAPERGLGVAIKALSKLDLDFKLNIFNEVIPDLLDLDDDAKKMIEDPRFFYYGKTPHKTVLHHISKSHIFIHPSIWHETFCISLAEALNANCLSVYSTFGSLKEIGSGFGMPYDIENEKNIEDHVKIFSNKITKAIQMIKKNEFNPGNQAEVINNKFSWEVFTKSWLELNKMV